MQFVVQCLLVRHRSFWVVYKMNLPDAVIVGGLLSCLMAVSSQGCSCRRTFEAQFSAQPWYRRLTTGQSKRLQQLLGERCVPTFGPHLALSSVARLAFILSCTGWSRSLQYVTRFPDMFRYKAMPVGGRLFSLQFCVAYNLMYSACVEFASQQQSVDLPEGSAAFWFH